jgi:hypothetical protein
LRPVTKKTEVNLGTWSKIYIGLLAKLFRKRKGEIENKQTFSKTQITVLPPKEKYPNWERRGRIR